MLPHAEPEPWWDLDRRNLTGEQRRIMMLSLKHHDALR